MPQPASSLAYPGSAAGDVGKAEGATALASITVSSRIAEFWPDQPRLWFVQFEAATESQKLSDAAKQNLVVTKLKKAAIEQVSDLLLSPPETNKYQALKERLLQVFEESETRQFQKLLSEMELGSQKPSQLLRRMRELARGKIPDATLQIMWSGHLPTAVQAVLTVTEAKELENLALIADKVMEATKPPEIATVSAGSSSSGSSKDLAALVKKLSIEVMELQRWRKGSRGERSGRQSRSRSRPRDAERTKKNPDWLCFYHYRYKNKAAKCIPPCNWKVKDTDSGN